MKVLVACEFSGIVRDAFITRGHDAMSCDLLPSEKPGPHYQGDVRDILDDGWDLMIAHPPCTYLSNSGVRWLFSQSERWQKMVEASLFFRVLLNADIPRVAVENPIMHGYARQIIQAKYSQIIQPYQFGHPERKSTCLWLKGLKPLEETNNVVQHMLTLPKNQQNRIHYMSSSADRQRERSRFFEGIAEAMAEQWESAPQALGKAA